MKNHNLLIILTLLFACGTTTNKPVVEQPKSIIKDNTLEIEVGTMVEMPNEISKLKSKSIPSKLLEDRQIGNFKLTFIELTQEQVDSIQNLIVSMSIPLSTAKEIIAKTDSCYIIQLKNTKQDTLCSFDDGEYHETYIVKGVWSEVNQLLVNFENWEEQHDYLLNLNDGSHYILGPEYRLSPSRRLILSFVDMISYPIYPNEFVLSEITSNGFIEYFNIDFDEHSVTSADWLTDKQLLITAGQINHETFELVNKITYLLKLDKLTPPDANNP